MRKTMTKEVTKTTLKVAEIITENGEPKLTPLEDEILLGNVSLEKAQKEMRKKYEGRPVQVFEVEPDTTKYQMQVEDFIKNATPVTDDEEVDEEDSEE